jgi:hypothetical protein
MNIARMLTGTICWKLLEGTQDLDRRMERAASVASAFYRVINFSKSVCSGNSITVEVEILAPYEGAPRELMPHPLLVALAHARFVAEQVIFERR